MECNYFEIERKFSDYILKLIGPNSEQNQIRENKHKQIKNILEKTFAEQRLKLNLFSFGSYPIRTYLPESDMDITLILEDTQTGQNLINNCSDWQSK
jgi:DNA polymerase sigma